jgi:hypothetical protein
MFEGKGTVHNEQKKKKKPSNAAESNEVLSMQTLNVATNYKNHLYQY